MHTPAAMLAAGIYRVRNTVKPPKENTRYGGNLLKRTLNRQETSLKRTLNREDTSLKRTLFWFQVSIFRSILVIYLILLKSTPHLR